MSFVTIWFCSFASGLAGLEQPGAQVALAGIRENHDDHLALVLGPPADFESGPQGRPARDAGEDAFLAGEPSRGGPGVLGLTWMISSIRSRRSTFGINPAPMPWILCGPAFPPESTGESRGSTATDLKDSLSLSALR